MNASEADIRAEIETKLRLVEEVVLDLGAKIRAWNEKLETAIHRRDVIKAFFEVEYGDPAGGPLFTIPKKFEGLTIRQACREVLKGSEGMHVADIASLIEEGGRQTSKNSVTAILVRGEEFARTGEQNTFYLIKEED